MLSNCPYVDLCTQTSRVPRKKESNFPPINISVAARREKTVGWQAEMRAKVFCKVSEAN